MGAVHRVMGPVDLWCRVCVLGPDGSELASWPVRGAGAPGLDVVDAVARLHLAVTRLGGGVVLRAVAPELRDLLVLAGLTGQVGGQAEQGEQPLRVEEEVEGGEPSP